ncbi:golgi uridine diphosphate-N- acetylglucosamine transporter [Dissophora globulifera]|nr:golgi uridine diphosphate-N- acetylglucosamine transporter [Dissophora globulifera]
MQASMNGPVKTTLRPASDLRHRSPAADQTVLANGRQDVKSDTGVVSTAAMKTTTTTTTTTSVTRTATAAKDPSKQPPKRSPSWSSWASMTLQVSLQDWILIATMIFGGCCSNVFALEILINDAPKSGQMITFAQFMFVSAYGLFAHLQWPVIQEWISPKTAISSSGGSLTRTGSVGVWRYIPHLKPRRIPLMRWMMIVVMFFAVSVLNNWSLAYKISVPLHIIFRSGGLVVGMVLGMILMKKRYSNAQMFAVLIVTIGVIYATTSTKASASKGPSSTTKAQEEDVNSGDYAIGVFMLTIALIVSSLMGLLQESTYQTYGSEWREGLFYSHFLALPMFLMFYSDIVEQVRVFNRSTPIPILQLVRQIGPYLPTSLAYRLSSITIPRLWIFLTVNTLTQ